MKKRILAILLTFIMLCSLMPVGAVATDGNESVEDICACGGDYENGFCVSCDAYQPADDADADGVYEIGNAGQLYWFADLVNSGTNNAANGILTADIIVNSGVLGADGMPTSDNFREWTPIGNSNNAFQGSFDGNNHTIQGLYLDGYAPNEIDGRNDVALFGNLRIGGIQNVSVKDSYLTGYQYVSGICGRNNRGSILNCSSDATLKGYQYVAGICGNLDSASVTNCHNFGLVYGSDCVGGVVGQARNRSKLTGSSNVADITWISGRAAQIGGFAGLSTSKDAEFRECYSIGKVTYTYEGNGPSYVGGFIGSSYVGTFISCFSYCEIDTPIGNGYYVGGFTGRLTELSVSRSSYCLEDSRFEAIGVGVYDPGLNPKAVSKDEFKSGVIACSLNTNSNLDVWKQNLDNGEAPDDYPKFVGGEVYQNKHCDNSSFYSNIKNVYQVHDFGQLIAATEAIHTPEVLKGPVDAHYLCAICGIYITEAKEKTTLEELTGEAPSHTYGDPTCEFAAKCSVCGATIGEALGHKDEDKDHNCDYGCAVYQGVHADSAEDKDHLCDYGCGVSLEACTDVNGDKDHSCDICGVDNVTEHSYAVATCSIPATCSECGMTNGDALGHSYGEWTETKKATCVEQGEERRDCEACDAYELRKIDVVAHSAAEAVQENEIPASCVTEGTYDYVVYCAVCKNELSREKKTIAKTEHSAGDAVKENEKSASCVAKGSYDEVTYCVVCNVEMSRKTVEINTVAHSAAEAVQENEKPASCVAEGSYDHVVYCAVCKNELSREKKTIAKVSHVPNDGVKQNQIPATTEAGGSYELVVFCEVCGQELSRETVKTSKIEINVVVKETYTDEDIPQDIKDRGIETVEELTTKLITEVQKVDNEIKGSNTVVQDVVLVYSEDGGETWQNADESHFPEDGKLLVTLPVPEGTSPETHVYSVVHMFSSNAFGKVPGEIEIPEVTTRQETNGQYVLEFYVTGLSPIAIAYSCVEGHTFNKYVSNNDATCMKDGTKTAKCDFCDEVKTVTDEGSAKGHTEVIDAAVAATCTTSGKTEGKHCSVCNAVIVAQQEVAAKGHSEVIDAAVAATCTASGLTVGKHCSVCSAVIVKQEVIPAKGHSYSDGNCVVCGAKDPAYVAPTPTVKPTVEPTAAPTPTVKPTVEPTAAPTPTVKPTVAPTMAPTPTVKPTVAPTAAPTPTVKPTVTPTPTPVIDNPFKDVKDIDWFFTPVMWAKANGVTEGKTATTFAPNEGCTRAHVVTFLWAANGKPEPESTKNSFVDVKEGDWYYKPVLWAVENGITSGISADKFGPNQTCTRAQIVTFLYAAVDKPAVIGSSDFKDVKDTDWFAKPVIWAAQNEVTGGIGDGKFGPNNTCTRGQVVTFLYKVYGVEVQ